MADVIQQSDLENAKLDTDSLSDIVNGSIADDTVTTRLGRVIKTLAKAVDDISKVVPVVAYDTLSNLNADLSPEDNSLAYVLENDTFYVKNGASGSGSWDVADHTRLDLLLLNTMRINLFPDPQFEISANNKTYTFGGDGAERRIYNSSSSNTMTWNGTYKHDFGVSCWDITSSDYGMFNVWFDYDGVNEIGITTGDKISVGALAVGDTIGGYIRLYVQFFDTTDDNPVGSLQQTYVVATGNTQKVTLEDLTVPSGADGFSITIYGGNAPTTGAHILGVWAARGELIGDRVPTKESWPVFERRVREVLNLSDTSNAQPYSSDLVDWALHLSSWTSNDTLTVRSGPGYVLKTIEELRVLMSAPKRFFGTGSPPTATIDYYGHFYHERPVSGSEKLHFCSYNGLTYQWNEISFV